MKDTKFPIAQRTFETRVTFIRDLFSELFSQQDIMASCVAHKLDRSYLEYIDVLKRSSLNLSTVDPLKILNAMDE